MVSDLRQLAEALTKDTPEVRLERDIRAKREEIAAALQQRGEYILTDDKGRKYRITLDGN